MTQSGNDDPYRKNNDIGGYKYSGPVDMLLLNIASLYKSRHTGLQEATSARNIVNGSAPHPRTYAAAFTKAAACVWELAGRLKDCPFPPELGEMSECDWLTVLTGHSFKEHDCEQLTMQENAPVTEGLFVDSVSQLLVDGVSLCEESPEEKA